MLRKFSVCLAASALLLTAACGSNSDDSSSAKSPSPSSSATSITGVKITGDPGTEPKVTIKTPLKVSKAKTVVVHKGSGAPLANGKPALVHFTLENGTTGKTVGSTYQNGTPTAVQLDSSSLPQTLVTALDGKTTGSRIAIADTAEDIYGAQGNTQLGLKATDSLVVVFDILAAPPSDVLSAPKGATKAVPSGLPKIVEQGGKITTLDFSKTAKKPPAKLRVVPLVQGTGKKTTKQSLITINYVGQVWGAKKPFNNSYTQGQTATFPLGVGGLIKAWDDALVGVPVGSRVMLVAPPGVAYGKTGQKDAGIPKNATLVFVIDVLGASD